MCTRIIIALLALTLTASAQFNIGVTNNALGLVGPASTLTGPVGSFRLTCIVNDGVDPINLSESNLRLDVWDVTANPRVRVQQTTNSLIPDIDASQGQVRFLINSLSARRYELHAQLIAFNTNENIPIAWHYLDVTQSVSAASTVSLSLDPLIPSNGTVGTVANPWLTIASVDGYFAGSLTVGGDVNVEGGFEALDSTKVAKVGETNDVDLTNANVYVRTPTNDANPATKAYVDLQAGGITGITASASSAGVATQVNGQNWTIGTNLPASSNPAFSYDSRKNILPTNTADYTFSTNATAKHNIIGAGTEHIIDGAGTANFSNSVIAGGHFNKITDTSGGGFYNAIGGGGSNAISGANNVGSVIAGGRNITLSGANSAASGGVNNQSSAAWSFMGGGADNFIQANANYTTIGGGQNNKIWQSAHGFLGGGQNNYIGNIKTHAVIGGGLSNTNAANYSVIGGGWLNAITGDRSAILGGRGNQVTATNSAVVMGSSTIVTQANVVAVSHVLRIGGTNTVIAEAGMLAFNSGNFWVCRTNGTWEIIF